MGGRALPKQGEDKKFHVEGRVEVGTRKQAKGCWDTACQFWTGMRKIGRCC
jgi:hypothetical protein